MQFSAAPGRLRGAGLSRNRRVIGHTGAGTERPQRVRSRLTGDGFRLSRNFRGVSGSRYLKFNTWSRSSRPVLSDSLKVADDDELLPFPWDELFRV